MWGDFIFEYFEFFTSSVSILQVQQMEGSLYCAGTALLQTYNHAVQPIAASFLNEGGPQFTLYCLYCTLIISASSTTHCNENFIYVFLFWEYLFRVFGIVSLQCRRQRVFPVVFCSQRHFIFFLYSIYHGQSRFQMASFRNLPESVVIKKCYAKTGA
jgi:hypothetical protein